MERFGDLSIRIATKVVEMSSNMHLNDESANNGFLSGFVESTVEMPADGLNGDCIVHFEGDHSQYELIVTLVNGVREGEAIIVNDGIRYLRLEYKQGSLTGVVERMNDQGIPEMNGHLVNGMESGLFLEYDENDKVVWMGYYRNGQRYSEVRNRVMKSNCLEDGSGEFYELDENGQPIQLCLYMDGVKSRVLVKFNSTTMTELDENGKRVYEGGFKGDMQSGFVREGKGKEFVNGGREAVYYGDWKNGKRDGMGLEYERFKPVYNGEWKDGKRNGNGKEMDEKGKVMRSGLWVNGVLYEVMIVPFSLISNPQTIEELKIENNSYNNSSVTELKLIGLARLKQIVIGDECFGRVRLFELDGLNELESVMIGEGSFIISNNKRTDGSFRVVNCPKLKSIQFSDQAFCDYYSFELNNLPSLQSIETGEDCFFCAPLFSLTDLPQLQSVNLGNGAFYSVHSVVFENLPKLQSIQLGDRALIGDGGDNRKTFMYAPYNYKNTLTMRNLPSLTTFKGDDCNFRYIGSVILESNRSF